MTRGKVTPMAGVAVTAALEYLAAEILELAGNAARDCSFDTINSHHVALAVDNDAELLVTVNHYDVCAVPLLYSVDLCLESKLWSDAG